MADTETVTAEVVEEVVNATAKVPATPEGMMVGQARISGNNILPRYHSPEISYHDICYVIRWRTAAWSSWH